MPVSNIEEYDEIQMSITKPAGSDVRLQLAFSDNGFIWSDYCGSDGTSLTYYTFSGQAITLPAGYAGYYYKWKAILYSDGRETPVFDGLTIWEICENPGKRTTAGKKIIGLLP